MSTLFNLETSSPFRMHEGFLGAGNFPRQRYHHYSISEDKFLKNMQIKLEKELLDKQNQDTSGNSTWLIS